MPGRPRPRAPQEIEAAVAGGPGLEARASGSGAEPGGRLLLLCSPGRDSMCLLDLAVRRLGASRVAVLHVDHGLRAASAGEAEFVREAGDRLGVEVIVRAADGAPSGNLHDWARGQRHRLAAAEASRLAVAAVATAHTRTDLVETALFRLATQPGRRALLAMREREPDAFAPGVDLVRPLLGLSRQETADWCRGRGLRWVEDPSNADPRFARARLRHAVTPVLGGLNPRYEEAVVRTLAELEEEREALSALVGELLPPGRETVAIEALLAVPRPLARLVVRELCERAVGRSCPRAGARTDELLERAAGDRTPFQLDVGEGARLAVRGGVVRCDRSAGPAARRAGA